MDIKKQRVKANSLVINEDIITNIKIELKRVWTLYIVVSNRCLKESW